LTRDKPAASRTRVTLRGGRTVTIPERELPAIPPPPPPPDPNWPYSPEADPLEQTLAAALPHYLAIRAKGSTPGEGGPSFPIADRSAKAFQAAAGLALKYWPAAILFELIGSDSHFPAARLASDGLPESATLLRLAVPILEIWTKVTPRQAPPGWKP
jgi:hypothetical protein